MRLFFTQRFDFIMKFFQSALQIIQHVLSFFNVCRKTSADRTMFHIYRCTIIQIHIAYGRTIDIDILRLRNIDVFQRTINNMNIAIVLCNRKKFFSFSSNAAMRVSSAVT